MFKYKLITKDYYIKIKDSLSNIINNIWSNTLDAKKAISAIERSFETELFSYHYTIMDKNKIVGITWFYELSNNDKLLGLNHHWILSAYRWKWLWKTTLNDLIKIIWKLWYTWVNWLIELVPKEDLIVENIFLSMWFIEIKWDDIKNIETINKLINQWYYTKAYILNI